MSLWRSPMSPNSKRRSWRKAGGSRFDPGGRVVLVASCQAGGSTGLALRVRHGVDAGKAGRRSSGTVRPCARLSATGTYTAVLTPASSGTGPCSGRIPQATSSCGPALNWSSSPYRAISHWAFTRAGCSSRELATRAERRNSGPSRTTMHARPRACRPAGSARVCRTGCTRSPRPCRIVKSSNHSCALGQVVGPVLHERPAAVVATSAGIGTDADIAVRRARCSAHSRIDCWKREIEGTRSVRARRLRRCLRRSSAP